MKAYNCILFVLNRKTRYRLIVQTIIILQVRLKKKEKKNDCSGMLIINNYDQIVNCPIGLGCRIRQLYLGRSVRIVFVAASHQTRLDTRSKARRPIKVGIKGRGRSGTSRDSNPACQCCSSAHLVQCEPDEASSFTNPNVGPGTYASLRLKLDAWSSAVQGGQRRQKCSLPIRR